MDKNRLNRFKLPLIILSSVATAIILVLMIFNCVDAISLMPENDFQHLFFPIASEILLVLFVTGLGSMSIVASVYGHRIGWVITLLSMSSVGLMMGLTVLPLSSYNDTEAHYTFFCLLLLIVDVPLFILSLIHMVTFNRRKNELLAEAQDDETKYKNLLERDENK
ncbi:hypothetical protein LJC17_02400 [Acholeplasma sp. OttesenSCG-928-E16]|nr:hypothetical protein [Acholeplasma sp. OttesenSCG-928-E16]